MKPVSVTFSKYFVQENFERKILSSFICIQSSFQTTWALAFLDIQGYKAGFLQETICLSFNPHLRGCFILERKRKREEDGNGGGGEK